MMGRFSQSPILLMTCGIGLIIIAILATTRGFCRRTKAGSIGHIRKSDQETGVVIYALLCLFILAMGVLVALDSVGKISLDDQELILVIATSAAAIATTFVSSFWAWGKHNALEAASKDVW
jgi:hypothetical protein